MSVSKRKESHLNICLEKDVQFKEKSNGFERFDFNHCALPEVSLEDVDTETTFLDKKLSLPLMISAMTGGSEKAGEINENLAEVCQASRIGLGLGSQRQLLENDAFVKSYSIVRKVAPDALILGNIGAVQLALMNDYNVIQKMADLVEADAMVVHLNPLQEAVQPEGEPFFQGVLNSLNGLVESISCPVIVKEVGCGISARVARQLKNAGVYAIDIAGSGGTSWAGIESFRNHESALAQTFWDWGIPTAISLETCNQIPGIKIIASGGIRTPLEMTKALAMGAELCGIALPALKVLLEEGSDPLMEMIASWQQVLKVAMFLTGIKSIKEFRHRAILRKIDECE